MKTRKYLKYVSAVLFAGVAIVFIVVAMRSPSLTRDWDEDVSILSGVVMLETGEVTLTQVRNWIYSVGTIESKDYFEMRYDPEDIETLWMYEQLLDPQGLIAHTFLVFQFDESYGEARFLGLSVETRRESGEEYSVIGGALRSFEITHIWATEQDLVTRRVLYLDYPLTRYRLKIPREHLARLFTKFATETADLATVPQWYNTLTNNCTSSLVRYVNESEPGAIPAHYSLVLTGKIDDYLRELSYLEQAYSRYITRDYLSSNNLR